MVTVVLIYFFTIVIIIIIIFLCLLFYLPLLFISISSFFIVVVFIIILMFHLGVFFVSSSILSFRCSNFSEFSPIKKRHNVLKKRPRREKTSFYSVYCS